MGFAQLLLLGPQLLVTTFLPWYLWQRPIGIIKLYWSYAIAFDEILSIPFLMRTWIAPWKAIADEYPSNLMKFSELSQTLALNTLSRCIGFLFRTCAIAIGLAIQIILLVGFSLYFLSWIFYPVAIVLWLYDPVTLIAAVSWFFSMISTYLTYMYDLAINKIAWIF